MKLRFPHGLRRMRRHLYLQIFLAFLGILLMLAVLTGGLFWHYAGGRVVTADEHIAMLLGRLLPAPASAAENESVLRAINGISGGTVALYSASGDLLQVIGNAAPRIEQAIRPHAVGQPFHPAILPDGRKLVLEWDERDTSNHFGWIVFFLLLAAIGAYPVSRRLTRRIEVVQKQVEAWGQGTLSARVPENGCDEIAELAHHFNLAAERIESLLNSQRAMLASASHELRSPLARIRLASDLIGDERPDLQAQIAHDIAELDALIGDLLLASRLSSNTPQLRLESVDILGLAAEEASRAGAELDGEPLVLLADARLMRHLLRNLLENSRRYASGTPIEVHVRSTVGGGCRICVLDRGPGIPEAEQQKVFEPFYRAIGSAETGEGVGYGLALVKRIAQLHGGDAHYQPREGGGACFEVNFPKSVLTG